MPTDPGLDSELIDEITELKKRRGAVIMAHNYQLPEVQAVADHTGDSLGLARLAAETQARTIVLCGVSFMAETAAIICPDKTVLLPEPDAGCPLADMLGADDVREARQRFPGLYVISYVNSSAAVKAESDICCTSSNGVEVLRRAPAERPVLFCPDRHLGEYAARSVGRDYALYPREAPVMLWPGFCPTHHRVTVADVRAARQAHPRAEVMVHPECDIAVIEAADIAASTGGMLEYPDSVEAAEFIVGTEIGMLTPLEKRYPDRVFHPLAPQKTVCFNMKRNTLASLRRVLRDEQPVVEVPAAVAERARAALERMLAVG